MTASHGWFNRFKARHNLHNVKVSGEAASADVKAAEEFPGKLAEIIHQGGYTPQQIFNVDETGLYWKKMPDRTYISKEEKTMPGFKLEKQRKEEVEMPPKHFQTKKNSRSFCIN